MPLYFQFIQYRGNKQLCIQLDECQFEFVEDTVDTVVNFVQSIRNQNVETSENSNIIAEPLLNKSDSWDSVDTLSSQNEINDFVIQFSAKNLDCFFTAKRAAFFAFSTESLKIESSSSSNSFSLTVENIKIVQGELRSKFSYIPLKWYQMNSELQKAFSIQPCGSCLKIKISVINNVSSREFLMHFENTVELIWSPLLHVVFYEVYS